MSRQFFRLTFWQSVSLTSLTVWVSGFCASSSFASCVTDADCDDGVACTQDQCFNGTCRFNEVDSACDDNVYCNGAEFCDASLGCQSGTPPCIGNSCAEATQECTCDEDSDCDDGVFCNGAETCVNDDCVLATDPCDDQLSCTTDSCDEQLDQCSNLPDNAVCDNGDFCDGAEVCDLTQGCISGSIPCDDQLDCTDDSCDESTDTCTYTNNCNDGLSCTNDVCTVFGWCMYFPDDGPCDDGVFCNGVESCDPLNGDQVTGCAAGAFPCDDLLNCTDDTCDESTDSCIYTNNCDDGVDCTNDICPAWGECHYTIVHANCDDGDFCNGSEVCDAVAGCLAGSDPCADAHDCTTDNCDESTDTCWYTEDDLACDDLVDCTVDICDVTSGCLNTPDDGACDNGQYCDGSETCDAVAGCQAGTAPCNDGLDCTDDSCDESTDVCTYSNNCDDELDCTSDVCTVFGWCMYFPDDSPCDDGLYCNGVETCSASAQSPGTGCEPGSFPCNDGLNCTDDTCDESSDSCIYTNNCNDGVTCTNDICPVWGDCLFTLVHSNCDDGVFCNGAETCDPATGDLITGCNPGVTPGCDDGIGCTDDECDVVSDSCVSTNNCTDGIACTVDTCTPTGCDFSEDDALCDDSIGCTFDQCSIVFNGCRNLTVDAYCDDALFCTGEEICDPANGDPTTGCVTGTDPCGGIPCDEVFNTCAECVDDSDCPGIQKCCANICKLTCKGGSGTQ